MAIRLGIDLVSTASVAEAIAAHGDRYLHRIFTEAELGECSVGATVSAARLAARFAAKEATFKVLRVGARAVAWPEVEVLSDGAGGVAVALTGAAARMARECTITNLSASLGGGRHRAIAIVTAEIESAADR